MSKSKGHFILPAILQRSRDLRHPLTPSEAKIWHAVRSRQVGFKVRRQQPIGRFILDFYCAEAKLAIEIDGDIHTDLDQAVYDAARTQWLKERGYAVIRFEANQVDEHLPDVLDAIREACESTSGKAPLSRRETMVPGAKRKGGVGGEGELSSRRERGWGCPSLRSGCRAKGESPTHLR